MARYRNQSNATVYDHTTGAVAKPDEVITVPDEFEPSYEGHPIWAPVPDAPKPVHHRKPAAAKETA